LYILYKTFLRGKTFADFVKPCIKEISTFTADPCITVGYTAISPPLKDRVYNHCIPLYSAGDRAIGSFTKEKGNRTYSSNLIVYMIVY